MDSNPFAASNGVTDPFEDPNTLYENADFVDAPVETVNESQAYGGDFYASNPYEVVAKNEAKKTTKAKSKAKGGLASQGGNTEAYTFPGESDLENKEPSGSLGDDLARRERMIKLKEEALLEREAALRSNSAAGGGGPQKNWPSKCYPIAYHNIRAEIPERHRNLIRQHYTLLLWTWLCLVFNWFAVMVVFFDPPDLKPDVAPSASEFGFSIIYLIAGSLFSWSWWYRSIYNGCKSGKSRKWMMYFVFFFMHTVFVIVMTVGFPGAAGAGIWFFFCHDQCQGQLCCHLGYHRQFNVVPQHVGLVISF
mmetsp:Transcript_9795/g.18672  ORF Transcript_9795/g.18672 Transcript_9795/m.18672 type:complete len:307 (+) Transcript_9795:39-959(+)